MMKIEVNRTMNEMRFDEISFTIETEKIHLQSFFYAFLLVFRFLHGNIGKYVELKALTGARIINPISTTRKPRNSDSQDGNFLKHRQNGTFLFLKKSRHINSNVALTPAMCDQLYFDSKYVTHNVPKHRSITYIDITTITTTTTPALAHLSHIVTLNFEQMRLAVVYHHLGAQSKKFIQYQ